MQPAQDKKPEVVYRRTADPDAVPAATEKGPGYAPGITPLIIGFLLLLALILVLGLSSASKMEDVGFNARILTQEYLTRLTLLQELQLRLVKLNNEARLRDILESRGVTPPLQLPLD